VPPAIRLGLASLVIVGLTLAFVIGRQQARAREITEVCELFFTGDISLAGVPVARTSPQQAKGLSNRDDAGPGMLFAFEEPGKLAFWMRDTRMPLSIAFISEDGAIFAIEDMTPGCHEYHLSVKPAKYALELRQGQFDQKGLTVGSRLMKQECRHMR
jgi:uncharacterized membrane protein (UPF0127 family)